MSLALSDPAQLLKPTTADSGARATAEHSPSSAPVDHRANLLAFLTQFTADRTGYVHLRPRRDLQGDHQMAECLLLLVLQDPEVAAAWHEAAEHWWYA